MPQAIVAAAATTILAVGLWGVFLRLTSREHARWAPLALWGLPMGLLANTVVRAPLSELVAGRAGWPPAPSRSMPFWLIACLYLVAPLTEEAIKLVPAVSGGLRARLRSGPAPLWAGMFIGAGFGIGEIWSVAASLLLSPFYVNVPWHQMTGFMTERLLLVYAHGVMTAVAVAGLVRGRSLQGYLAAVGLHAVVNLGGLLYQLRLLGSTYAQVALGATVLGLSWVFGRLYLMLDDANRRTAQRAPDLLGG